MREIKFRIIHNGQTYYWGYIESGFAGIPTSTTMDMELAKKLSCQYTGLKDKNGKEIYEGDIVRRKSYFNDVPKNCIAPICWDKERLRFDVDYIGDSSYWRHMHNLSLEIIGNIYENPELLNSKD